MTHEEAVALFERRRDAWLREDVDAYLALWADDMRFQSPVHADAIDRAAFAALVRQSLAVARPIAFDFIRIAANGETVLAEWRIEIERRQDGRRVRWSGMSAAVVRGDGRIASWREYWNPTDLA